MTRTALTLGAGLLALPVIVADRAELGEPVPRGQHRRVR